MPRGHGERAARGRIRGTRKAPRMGRPEGGLATVTVLDLTNSCDAEFVAEVARESGQNLTLCYQCGNCTAGCPYTFAYDLPVSSVMRALQWGQRETVLTCKSIWICATCKTCTTRCPNDIDVARIMEVLRQMSRRGGYAPEKKIKQFQDSFLQSVMRHGRVFELGTMMSFIARSRRLTDLDLGPKAVRKGKLFLRAKDIHGRDEVEKIFRRYKEGLCK